MKSNGIFSLILFVFFPLAKHEKHRIVNLAFMNSPRSCLMRNYVKQLF